MSLFTAPMLALDLELSSGVNYPIKVGRGFTTPEGEKVVLAEYADRIQVYDSNWNFLRGWHFDSAGGIETIAYENETINIFTARGDNHYTYDVQGNLLDYSVVLGKLPPNQNVIDMHVPGPLWKWLFLHPVIGWLIIVLGMVITGLTNKEYIKSQRDYHKSRNLFGAS